MGHPDLLCKIKTAGRRGMLDELLHLRSVAESLDALRQGLAGVCRVLAEAAMGCDWDAEDFLQEFPPELLTRIARGMGLELVPDLESIEGEVWGCGRGLDSEGAFLAVVDTGPRSSAAPGDGGGRL